MGNVAAIDPAGTLFTVYTNFVGPLQRGFATREKPTGGWDSPIQIGAAGENSFGAAVGADTEGNAIGIFGAETGDRVDVYAVHFN